MSEKIATLYNGLGKERVTNFGAYTGRIFREKPWRNDTLRRKIRERVL